MMKAKSKQEEETGKKEKGIASVFDLDEQEVTKIFEELSMTMKLMTMTWKMNSKMKMIGDWNRKLNLNCW